MVANDPTRARDMVDALLNRGYDEAAAAVLVALTSQVEGGIVAQRLRELEAEARRLAAEGKPMRVDNPVLQALLGDYEQTLRGMAGQLNDNNGPLVENGIQAASVLAQQLTLPGFSDPALAAIGIQWNRPDPEAIARVVAYTSTEGWRDELGAFTIDMLNAANNHAIAGIVSGRGPVSIARDVAETIQTQPLYRVTNLFRTLHNTAFRDAMSTYYAANADILESQIRIAVLDTRVCLCCLALHGTVMPVGARVEDHHSGRCTSIGIVRGRPWSIQTGPDWFNSLPEAMRLEIAEPANFAALEAGAVRLQDFVQPYNDRVFGPMVREASLVGVLGDAAKNYYTHN